MTATESIELSATSLETVCDLPIEEKRYAIGTLRYTFRGLIVLFAWLMWGDFAFTFFESIFGQFIPLYLKQYNAPNALIGVMMGSIAGGVNLLFLPSISRWSDDHRGRWGRRRPLLFVATPLTVVSMILLGFAPELAALAQGRLIHRIAAGISFSTVVLSMICVFVVAFHFLNMLLVNSFTWLQRDVVPQEWMARFLSWFRFVTTFSSILFSWLIFPYIITRRREICLGIGLFYLITFGLMCWKVKEGKYPPPPVQANRPNPFVVYCRYFKTCLSVPIYRYFFFATMAMGLNACSGAFSIFFQRDMLGISMEHLGKIRAVQGIISTALLLPMGWVCDTFNAFRVYLLLLGVSLLLPALNYFFVYNERTFVILAIVGPFIGVPLGLASGAVSMQLFPAAKFGQFSAAGNIFGMGIQIVGNYLFGHFLDMTHSNYRMIFVWNFACGLPIFLLTFAVFRHWRRHGGPDFYVAPLPIE